MKTDVIKIGKDDKSFDEALSQAERFASYRGMKPKDSLRLRLLAEEAMGMIAGITGGYEAKFWIEGDGDTSTIVIEGKSEMDFEKRDALMSASTSGENILAKGVMGKIRSIFENALSERPDPEYADMISYGMMDGSYDPYGFGVTSYSYCWSLRAYTKGVEENRNKDLETAEAWDELEKSLVAKLSDEVRIGAVGDRVKMMIVRKSEGK